MENLKLDQDKFFLVSAHREENVDNIKRLEELIYTLNILSDEYEFPIIFSTHPRTKKQLSKIDTKPSNKIIFHQPFGFIDYIALQKKSLLVLSDSGTISEEASILDFKAINIRSSHERPEAMEETSLLMSDINKERILQAIKSILTKTEKEREFKKVNDYDVLNVSKKVERIILSYTGYINKNVWNKES